MRIAIGSVFQESNEFVANHTELELFRNTYIYHGEDLFQLAGTGTEISGALEIFKKTDVEVLPLTAAACVPSGALSSTCYEYLRSAVLAPLQKAEGVDGVLLCLHGSMTCVSEGDPEGDLLEAVRAIVGSGVPIVATLDMHAWVTDRMVKNSDALIAYTSYPHDDTYSTGQRGASLLVSTVKEQVKPCMARCAVPIVPAGCNGMTFGDGPMSHLTRRAREIEEQSAVLSVSCCAVHPNNDQPDLSSCALVITDGQTDLARDIAMGLARDMWDRRHGFIADIYDVAEAVELGRETQGGPVLLVDTADCAGGGAPGDSVALLSALLRLKVRERTCLMTVDPAAAAACRAAGTGSKVTLELGYSIDPNWGSPVRVTGVVQRTSGGRFRYTGGIYGGTDGMMGPSSVLQIGSIDVLVMSHPTYDWADEQYRSMGLDPNDYKFIGVKNPMNYRYAYKNVSKGAFIVDTPGPTPADVRGLPYKKRGRPFFPMDDAIDELIFGTTVNI